MNFIADWPIFVTPNNALDFSFCLALDLTLMKTRNTADTSSGKHQSDTFTDFYRLSFSATKANVILKIFYLTIFILPPRHNFLKTM